MTNLEVRRKARGYNVPLWRIAEEMGVSESTMIRWLRKELDPVKQAAFEKAVDHIIAEREEQTEGD